MKWQLSFAAAWVVACSDSALAQLRAAHPGAAEHTSRIYNGTAPPPGEPGPPPGRAVRVSR